MAGRAVRAAIRRPLRCVALLALVTQALSASFVVDSFESPNASTDVAHHLADDGVLAGGNWERLQGPGVPHAGPLRAFQLPGYPAYLASGFRVLPRPLWRFISLPVIVLLVVCVADVALVLGGPSVAIAAGSIAALNPFMLVHGPVWDDVFFGATCCWLIFALVARRLARHDEIGPGGRWKWLAIVAAAAALGAWTRSEEQALALATALLLVIVPAFRRARLEGLAIAFGVVLALTSWGVRNERVLGSFFVGSSHDGISLWEANNPATSRAIPLGQVEALSTDTAVIGPLWREARGRSELESNRLFQRAGTSYLRTEPAAEAKLMLTKAGLTLAAYHPELPAASPRNVVGAGTNGLLFFLALLGTVSLWRQDRRRMLAALPFALASAGACGGLLLIGPIGTRYWITFQCAIWVLAGAGLVRLVGSQTPSRTA